MREDISLRYEPNIAKVLDHGKHLFQDTDLPELAEKWDRILQNYYRAKGIR